MKPFFKNNSLSLVLFTIFFVLLIGQSVTGYLRYNQEQEEHQSPDVSFGTYLQTGHFLEAVAENWESEFLQMGAYVILTVFLFQKGSAESKKIDEPESVDREPQPKPGAPWPVRRGGWVLKLYQNSLSIAFISLFLIAFFLHAAGGAAEYCADQQAHNLPQCPNAIQYMGTSQFWFESFQNWQSEFLAMAGIVVLSIYLRQKGSPESKPVDAPHSETGKD